MSTRAHHRPRARHHHQARDTLTDPGRKRKTRGEEPMQVRSGYSALQAWDDQDATCPPGTSPPRPRGPTPDGPWTHGPLGGLIDDLWRTKAAHRRTCRRTFVAALRRHWNPSPSHRPDPPHPGGAATPFAPPRTPWTHRFEHAVTVAEDELSSAPSRNDPPRPSPHSSAGLSMAWTALAPTSPIPTGRAERAPERTTVRAIEDRASG